MTACSKLTLKEFSQLVTVLVAVDFVIQKKESIDVAYVGAGSRKPPMRARPISSLSAHAQGH